MNTARIGWLFVLAGLLVLPGCGPTKEQQAGKAARDRGVALALDAKLEEAIAEFTEAIRLDPELAHAYRCRAAAYCFTGERDKAWADAEAYERLGHAIDPELRTMLGDRSPRQ